MSKYKAEWKEFSVNEEFWKEVFVGRTITDILINTEPKTVKISGTEIPTSFPHVLELDSGEKVWIHMSAEWNGIYREMIGTKISGIRSNNKGITHIDLENGDNIEMNLDVGNFCIED